MRCPFCQSLDTRVLDTDHKAAGGTRRRRECKACHRRFSTVERVVEMMPLVIKKDGRREAFNRAKLTEGIRIACAKQPVSAEAIERLVDRVEAQVAALNQPEVPARVIGDLVLEGLRELSKVAYIRYAIVYLSLNDLDSVKREIEKLVGNP